MRELRLGVDPTDDVLGELDAEAARDEWQVDAVCQWVDPELWFPQPGIPSTQPVQLCRTCPVMAECRASAFENLERYGVWGGLSEDGRARMWGRPDRRRKSLISALAHVDGLKTEEDQTKTGKKAA